jgi:VWFA-related protein
MPDNCTTRHTARQLTQPFIVTFALILPALFCMCASGQSAPQSASAPAIVTNVDEVSLDLVVRDKKNKPVLDLKPEDLAVTDNGVPVKISDLRLVNGKSSSEHLLTLVFDQMDSAAVTNSRNIAAKIMKTIPQSGFLFAVMNIEGRLKLYQEFTADRPSLTKAIGVATGPVRGERLNGSEMPEKRLLSAATTGTDDSGTRLKANERAIAQMMLAALENSQRIVQEQHTSPSMAGLLSLARTEGRIPGRKVVIYFAQGIHLDASGGQMLDTIVRAASRSDVAIYVVDANALSEQSSQSLLSAMALGNSVSMTSSRVSAPQTATGPPPTPFGDLTTGGMKSQISSQYERFELPDSNGAKGPLAQLAESTGGAYIHAGDNPRKPVRKMIDEMTTYYEASYVPPNKDYDGQFRPVGIKPLRAGIKVRSRAGYFALPPDSGSGIRPFETPLLKLLAEKQLPSEVKLRFGILQLGELTGGNTNTLVLEVPVSELETRDDPNTNLYFVHVSVVAEIKNKAGEVIEHFSEDVPRHGKLDSNDGARAEVITIQRHFIANPGEYLLETAVLDHSSGKAGAQRSNFVISSGSSGPSLSDLALVKRLDPFPEDSDSSEPLRYGSSKVVPNLSGDVIQGAKEVSLFSVIHPDPQSSEQPRLEMAVMRNNEALAQVPLQLRKINGAGVVPYMASIHAAGLPPGDYEIIESLTQGGRVAERSLVFRIKGPQLATVTSSPTLMSSTGTGKDDIELATVSKLQAPGTNLSDGRRLVITALPPGSVPPPSADELQETISAARKHALGYANSLPNFICVEVTNRSVASSSNGNWRHRDTFAEMLRYVDSQETRTMLERNGQRTSLQRTDLDSTWPLSVGEFGGLLNLVFQPTSKTEFQWKEADALGSGTVQVLTYRVEHQNASFALSDSNRKIGAGFHGLVYLDSASGGIRRITLEADDLPHDFSIHAASMTVDYDYVAIGAHDYLMPMRAVVTLQKGHKQTDLNEIAFRNYRRYASQTKISVVP